jgi:hypothetical protein
VAEELETAGLTLEPIIHWVSRTVDALELDRAYDIRAHVEGDVLRSLLYSLEATVYAEKVLERTMEVTVDGYEVARFPTGVWQHWKSKFAPGWFLRRWPVELQRERLYWRKTRTVVLEQFAKYPECPLRMPEGYGGARHIRYEQARVRAT